MRDWWVRVRIFLMRIIQYYNIVCCSMREYDQISSGRDCLPVVGMFHWLSEVEVGLGCGVVD